MLLTSLALASTSLTAFCSAMMVSFAAFLASFLSFPFADFLACRQAQGVMR